MELVTVKLQDNGSPSRLRCLLLVFISLLFGAVIASVGLGFVGFPQILQPRSKINVKRTMPPIHGDPVVVQPTSHSDGDVDHRGFTEPTPSAPPPGPWCSGRSNHTETGLGDSRKPGSKHTRKTRYFLTAVVVIGVADSRIVKNETNEFIQWLQYLSYAGVEHVYVFDAHYYKNDLQMENLRCFIRNGFVTYVIFDNLATPYVTMTSFTMWSSAYQQCLDRFGNQFVWQVALDIDEYPYSPADQEPGFLIRGIKSIVKEATNVGQIFLRDYLLYQDIWHPEDGRKALVIERFKRQSSITWNHQLKSLYLFNAVNKTDFVSSKVLRHGYMKSDPNDHVLRINHYHGERHKKLNLEKLLALTTRIQNMDRVLTAMRKCISTCSMGCCYNNINSGSARRSMRTDDKHFETHVNRKFKGRRPSVRAFQ